MSIDPSKVITVTPHGSFKAIPEHSKLELVNITPTATPFDLGPQYPQDTDPAPLSNYFIGNRPACAISKDECWYIDFVYKIAQNDKDFANTHSDRRYAYIDSAQLNQIDSVVLVNFNTGDKYIIDTTALRYGTDNSSVSYLQLTGNDKYLYIFNNINIIQFNKQTKQFVALFDESFANDGNIMISAIACTDQIYYIVYDETSTNNIIYIRYESDGTTNALGDSSTLNLSDSVCLQYGTTYTNKLVYIADQNVPNILVVAGETVTPLYIPQNAYSPNTNYLIESLEPGKTLTVVQLANATGIAVLSLSQNDLVNQTSTWTTLYSYTHPSIMDNNIDFAPQIVGVNAKEYFIYTSSLMQTYPLIIKISNGITHTVSSDASMLSNGVFAQYPPKTSTILNIPVKLLSGDDSEANVGRAQMMARTINRQIAQ